MSKVINIQNSIVLTPNGYTNTGSYNFTTTASGTNAISNAYTNSSSTSYGRLTLASSSNATRQSQMYLEFDKSGLSNIPSNATINSITCSVKYYVSNTTYVSALSMQLYTNTTAKGSAITNRTTSAATYSITPGT